jgi:hypothetical protein
MVKNTEAMITTFDLTRPRFWGKTSGALEEKDARWRAKVFLARRSHPGLTTVPLRFD